MKTITVLLVEDHAIVREGFRRMLELEGGFDVVGEADGGRGGLALALKLRPAVVVMDVAMPLMNGVECARQILKALPSTKVLMLSAHSDDAYVLKAMEMGASGFLVKQSTGREVCQAIRVIQNGGTHFTASILRHLDRRRLAAGNRAGDCSGRVPDLTRREAEVLQLIAEGKANKEAAAEMGISIKTVEKHRQRVMEKLDIHDTAGLTRYAIGAGIIESHVPLTLI